MAGGWEGEDSTFSPSLPRLHSLFLSVSLPLSRSLSPFLTEGVNVWEKWGLVPEPQQNASASVPEALEVSHCHDVTATEDG